MSDHDLHELRILDPAHPARRNVGRDPGSQAMLQRILTEPRAPAPVADSRSRSSRRWVLLGAAAAAVAVGLVTVPRLGTTDHAFATWTAVPEELAPATHADVAAECSAAAGGFPEGERGVTVAEDRGRVTFLVSADAGGVRHCLLVDGRFHSSGFVSNVLGVGEPAPRDAEALMATGSGGGADAYTAVTGRVGTEVLAVEVVPGASDTGAEVGQGVPAAVTATVEDGYFAAWWPGELTDSGLALSLHLTDGSVVEDLPAFTHDR